MKKAFTLLEIVISITIFSIILIFFYKTLDDTSIANAKFENHLYKNDETNHLYKVFLEDIAEATTEITIQSDNDKNSIVKFKTNNSFHNGFYQYITYMVASNNKLVRIESFTEFKKEQFSDEFFEKSYIDKLLVDVEKFIVKRNSDKIVFIIKQKDKERIIFPTFMLKD